VLQSAIDHREPEPLLLESDRRAVPVLDDVAVDVSLLVGEQVRRTLVGLLYQELVTVRELEPATRRNWFGGER